MSITDLIFRRGIVEILHFTSLEGFTGIIHERCVKARSLLIGTKSLEFIRRENTPKILDEEWKGYVNLSISKINLELLGHSKRWHPTQSWRILSFDPVILTHHEVFFVTTNNAYWMHLERSRGVEGLERMFAEKVRGKFGYWINRTTDMPINWTTDPQAEVLYPHELSTDHLRKVYVPTSADEDSVVAVLATLEHPQIVVEVRPDLFQT